MQLSLTLNLTTKPTDLCTFELPRSPRICSANIPSDVAGVSNFSLIWHFNIFPSCLASRAKGERGSKVPLYLFAGY